MRRHIAFVLGSLLLFGLAGCGEAADSGVATAGGDKTSGSAAPASIKEAALKYARCMRENGVPDFEDPQFDENGEIDGLGLPKGVDEETGEAAREKCAKHLPNGGELEQMNPEDIEKLREYAQCMRENGVSEFPDPDADGRLRVDGIDMNSAGYKAANEKCRHLTPGGGGGVFQPGGK
jgi:hypothetical protein